MESVTLEKNYQRRQFSPKAAKIAIEHYGWSELAGRPSEVGTKTKPPIIDKPVKLKPIDYPIQKAEVNDDLAQKSFDEDVKAINAKANFEPLPAASDELKEPVKKPRKIPVKSKSKSK